MHMADALLSPAVGGTMWAVSAAAIAFSSTKVSKDLDDRKVPLMGVLGAFLFAAQLINFSIPATGSSGHLSGGLLIAILLGPDAAFLTTASVLVLQALLFADGGLLALGCNIFNLGFIPAFLVYPLCYRKLIGDEPGSGRASAVTLLSAVIALQLGALAVVLETFCSGISSLPIATFLLLMQPIHFCIGVVEGAATLAVVSFVAKARPEMVRGRWRRPGAGSVPMAKVLAVFVVCALFAAGALSLFASRDPDGLEWTIAKVTGRTELPAPERGVHDVLGKLQQKSACFPDYGPRTGAGAAAKEALGAKVGAGLIRILGTLLTLVLVLLIALMLRKRKAGRPSRTSPVQAALVRGQDHGID